MAIKKLGIHINLGVVSPASIQVAIQYKVNGNMYWDNNGNQNYTLNKSSAFSVLNSANLFPTKSVTAMFDKLHGELVVKNIAYQKHVKVVYTVDGWATSNEIAATYKVSDGTKAETWEFTADIPLMYTDALPTIEYAISYEVAGTTYWDNNHGRNYTVTRLMGSTR